MSEIEHDTIAIAIANAPGSVTPMVFYKVHRLSLDMVGWPRPKTEVSC